MTGLQVGRALRPIRVSGRRSRLPIEAVRAVHVSLQPKAPPPNATYFLSRASVGQSFGFASELRLGPELALLPMNRHEFAATRADWTDGRIRSASRARSGQSKPPVPHLFSSVCAGRRPIRGRAE
jgi:hypothetical protein